jgi:serine protease Do
MKERKWMLVSILALTVLVLAACSSAAGDTTPPPSTSMPVATSAPAAATLPPAPTVGAVASAVPSAPAPSSAASVVPTGAASAVSSPAPTGAGISSGPTAPPAATLVVRATVVGPAAATSSAGASVVSVTPKSTGAPTAPTAAGTAAAQNTVVAPTMTPSPSRTTATATAVRGTNAVTATISTSPAAIAAFEGVLEDLYVRLNPSVVNIAVVQGVGNGGVSPSGSATPRARITPRPTALPDVPQIPSIPSIPQGPSIRQGLGSGFVWDKLGNIVTNNHVVAGADRITVTFADGTIVAGKVVSADPDSDLAVVKVDLPADKLQPVVMADSSKVRVGQLAIAIGNPFGLQGTMTVGFVSGISRSIPAGDGTTIGSNYTIPDIIQTDAPINPGNSGGILADAQGRIMGVTAAIESPVRASAGVGFAIPSAIVQQVVPVLIQGKTYEHAWLGISGSTLSPEIAQAMGLKADQRGALVASVTKGSPADAAGLKGSDQEVQIDGLTRQVGGDIITAIDGQPVRTFDDLVAYLARAGLAGSKSTLTILRGGKEQSVDVTLAARPTPAPAVTAQARRTATPPVATATPTPAPRSTPRSTTPPSGTPGAAGSAWLGVRGTTLNADLADAMGLPTDTGGVMVVEVVDSSPASDAGLRAGTRAVTVNGQRVTVGGDIIVAVDDTPVASIEDLQSALGQARPGQDVSLSILRNTRTIQVQVTLAARP